jgi:hypothetical protein
MMSGKQKVSQAMFYEMKLQIDRYVEKMIFESINPPPALSQLNQAKLELLEERYSD